MLLPRTLSGLLETAVQGFPAVLVTGPRQSGKTTLLRTRFEATHGYVSLEAPHIRERALADPVGFLADHPAPVILDEIQNAPALLSYLQGEIDADRRPGRWLFSGSQSFHLVQGTSPARQTPKASGSRRTFRAAAAKSTICAEVNHGRAPDQATGLTARRVSSP